MSTMLGKLGIAHRVNWLKCTAGATSAKWLLRGGGRYEVEIEEATLGTPVAIRWNLAAVNTVTADANSPIQVSSQAPVVHSLEQRARTGLGTSAQSEDFWLAVIRVGSADVTFWIKPLDSESTVSLVTP